MLSIRYYCQYSGEFDQNVSQMSNAQEFAWGEGEQALLELTNTYLDVHSKRIFSILVSSTSL